MVSVSFIQVMKLMVQANTYKYGHSVHYAGGENDSLVSGPSVTAMSSIDAFCPACYKYNQ